MEAVKAAGGCHQLAEASGQGLAWPGQVSGSNLLDDTRSSTACGAHAPVRMLSRGRAKLCASPRNDTKCFAYTPCPILPHRPPTWG